MGDYKKLSKTEIKKQYKIIKSYHERFLKQLDVKLPKLKNSEGNYTKDALVLVYLSMGYPKTEAISKTELTKFIRTFYPEVNDVQQARHLGAQKGWWIVAGGRDNIVLNVKMGYYQLHSLQEPYPAFHGHRVSNTDNWDELKKEYGYRCATCGSVENQPNLNWPATKTKLQKSHMDPNKPLVAGNMIPQCQKCNRADRNRWVYDQRGRVIKLAKASFVKNFDKSVRQNIYKILSKEFKGKNPNKK